MEAAWPEYKDTHGLMCRAAYLSVRASDAQGDAAQWVKTYLSEDVNKLQLRKQHHVHILNPEKKREGAAHCMQTERQPEIMQRRLSSQYMVDR